VAAVRVAAQFSLTPDFQAALLSCLRTSQVDTKNVAIAPDRLAASSACRGEGRAPGQDRDYAHRRVYCAVKHSSSSG
jgi:hypothetical protein